MKFITDKKGEFRILIALILAGEVIFFLPFVRVWVELWVLGPQTAYSVVFEAHFLGHGSVSVDGCQTFSCFVMSY